MKAIRILVPLAALAAAATLAVSSAVIGAYFFVLPALPPAETIRDIPLQVPLRVFSRDGKLISEIGEQRRVPVAYDDIPPVVVQALLAAEDDRFFDHPGVDYQGILRAIWKYALSGSRSQGGSTITMQLARDYFLSRKREWTRKIREIFLAYRIEKEFTKEEILTMFLNKMFFGQRSYGIAAATQVFFGKELKDINAAEAATLVGALNAPSRNNPVSGPDRARERRAYVLRRMHELGYLDDMAYTKASDYPLVSRLHGPDVELSAPYVAEMVRSDMLNRYGGDIYVAGYEVVTTLDSRLQAAADNALRTGLLEYDRRHGYRGAIGTVDAAIATAPDAAERPEVRQALVDYPEYGGLRVALITGVDAASNRATALLRDDERITIPWNGIVWAGEYIDDERKGPDPESITEVLSPGDVVYVIPTVTDIYALAQQPQVEGAFVAMDPDDGAIVSLTGGFDFSATKFNRAVQIERQPGSTFKPFIYSAALEHGFTAATIINDAPIVIESEELEAVWRPLNYGGRFHGDTRMREALYRSFNLVSVRILIKTGIGNAIRHLEKFGFTGKQTPRDTSLALGSGAMSPLELATGYTVFANSGYKIEPYYIDAIYNSEGEELFRAKPAVVCPLCEPTENAQGGRKATRPPVYETADQLIDRADDFRPGAAEAPELYDGVKIAPRVIDERNAYIVSDMMRDVIRRGTGVRAKSLGRDDLSGKTGTSNDRRDAWFAGFNADLVAATWVGFDADRPLGMREEGSRTALPIWIHFMETALDGVPSNAQPQPPGLTTLRVSAKTGKLARPGERDSVFETFRDEFAPQPDFMNNEPELVYPFGQPDDETGVADDPLF